MEEKISNGAYEYLYATIQTADWISEEYKKVAEQYRDHEALKELYLCICDGVSLDLLEVMVIDKDIEDILRKARKKHLESDFLRKYSDAVERISVITAKTEYEVKNMSSTVKYIADSLPGKTKNVELPEPIVVKEENELLDQKAIVKESSYNETEIVHESETSSSTSKEQKRRSWFEKLIEPILLFFDKYKRNPKRSVIYMLSQGYSDEQISFLYSCIDEGMTSKELDKIASPKISVETMKQLKKVVLKERVKNG